MVGRLFQNCRFKNAVFAPTNRDYIDSMVSKIDSICTTFDSIICGGVHVHRLDFMKIELIRATLDSIIRGGVHRLDFMKIELIRAMFDSIIHGGENRLDSHSGENIHNGDTCTKINSIFTPLAFGIWERDWTCTRAVNMYLVAVVILQG